MSTNQKLIPFCLKLDSTLWDRIDRQRKQRMGITHSDPITKTSFLREAVEWYCDFVDEKYSKKYELLKELNQDQDSPLGFYFDDGRESSWI